MTIDTEKWSGDGEFTRQLLDALVTIDGIAAVRVEDSPASRNDTGFAFLSNEVFVTFATRAEPFTARVLGVVPVTRVREVPVLGIAGLAGRLGTTGGIGTPDYQDEGMLQYLRAERVVAPWQTKGIKVVEMVRIYEAGHPPIR
jgi:hypothetical protein